MYIIKEMKSFLINRKRGMTFPEVMVVITIIGIISSIVLANMGEGRKRARDAVRIRDAQEIAKQIDFYLLENKQFPDAGTDVIAFSGNNWGISSGVFLSNSGFTLPLDPKNGQDIPGAPNSVASLTYNAFLKYQYIYLPRSCSSGACPPASSTKIDPIIIYFPLEGNYPNSPRCQLASPVYNDIASLISSINDQTSGASVTCQDIKKGGCFVENGGKKYTNWACVKSGFESI